VTRYRELTGKGSYAEATAPQSPELAERIERAERLLPGEHPWLVVTAAAMVEGSGEKATRASVLARLKATGRTRAQDPDADPAGSPEGDAG
jgi:hypothetical protein